ncbi:ribosome small subunit-dependent GTPase A [Aliiroseovarius sp. KMU-50]|uniref:Small ribosomal subunit biogenesis GTPase RsgA n=1 Tax=Aliiroseovarius salicola TaxID=3009082 RepID=A0ABT4VWE6_9RHOB|nr:ribosome small subunit-dependent GTPase A [Aliiroseovarius sp. KMU-50]MDA5092573.1 ribosome small subunit-dependent GTPase A [Aliiroseovarius sp. KMU-50]
MTYNLTDLGWSNYFARQALDLSELTPFRISEVHRDRLSALGVEGETGLISTDHSTGDFAVGDWVLADEQYRITHLLERQTELKRRAAGTDARMQLIAANVDVLFITSSCNADFNPARIERFLALAHEAGCFAVLVLTKADQCDDPREMVREAERLAPALPVLAINALDPDGIGQLEGWLSPGQTAALVGSSGVGKTTLMNGLCGLYDATQGIREDDAKGRHTTTSRALRPTRNGGWLIDTPGMRALRLADAGEGIDALFDDLVTLAAACRFSDCQHGSEPGCAVQAAIENDELDPDRLRRWQKLQAEDRRNSETIAESRARDKAFGKMVNSVVRDSHHKKGR